MTYPSSEKVILIGKESAWGTAVTPAKDVGVVQDSNDGLDREITETMGMGTIEVLQVHTGNIDANGSFSYKFQHGRMFEYALGSVAHAETTSDWKHTFTIADSAPSFTLESSENDVVDTNATFAGCLVENMEVSINNTDELKCAIDWKGKTLASTSASTGATISSLITFPKSMVHVTFASAEAAEVQEASIKFVKKVERSYGIGSNLPQQGHAVELRFQFSATVGFSSKTMQEYAIGGTSPPSTADPTGIVFQINAHNGVTLGSGRREMMLALENCQFTSYKKAAAVGDLIFITFAGSGTLKECFNVDNISSTNW